MSSHTSNKLYWLVWVALTLAGASFMAWVMFDAEDKSLFMPGPLSNGHHQLVDACDSCHTDSFGGGEVLQQACLDCHGDDRVKPFDSHPRSKFTDPRNADRLEQIKATDCVTCHTEHKPEITLKNGLSQPKDVCFHCHQDIAEERPSHKDMAFDTCASAGCHNYHNNRALYTDFLVKHMDAPDQLSRQRLPSKDFSEALESMLDYPRDHYPIEPLALGAIDAPTQHNWDEPTQQAWLKTSHAEAGVNCSACHQPKDTQGETTHWLQNPGQEVCQRCHSLEVQQFGKGKHGMRLAAGLSPMQVKDARLPMHDQPKHAELTCNSCHSTHQDDVAHAAVEACLNCHNDTHSRAYKGTPHHKLWQAEQAGTARPNTGVSCASCHMPRIEMDVSDWLSRNVVDHNQSANLAPNSKMIRSACQHCHGLGMSIDALADRQLIERNFDRAPSVHVDSIDLARADQERYLKELEAAKAKNNPE